MRATPRKYRIVIERSGPPFDDGMTTQPGAFATYLAANAAIIWGSGNEQRKAAQEGGAQIATFEVLSNAKTRDLSVTDRIRYPVSGADASEWPIWDIQAVSDLGLNDGVRVTAQRASP
jgi:hypothetical protein